MEKKKQRCLPISSEYQHNVKIETGCLVIKEWIEKLNGNCSVAKLVLLDNKT